MEQQLKKPKILKFEGKILDAKNLTPSVKQLSIETPEDFSFIPGQFVSILLNNNGEEIKRSYSIASRIDDKNLELCIKILENGIGTQIINKLKVGDILKIIGPLGHFVIQDNSKEKPITFISTGTGITPFRPMIDFLLKNGFSKKIILITGYKTEEEILYDEEFKKLTNYPNFSYNITLSRSENSEKKYVQDIITGFINSDSDYYVCGLKDMIYSVRDILLEKGIPRENIFFERYD